MKKRKKWSAADLVILVMLSLLALVMIYPFYNVLVVSLSAHHNPGLNLFPDPIDFGAYREVFRTGVVPKGLLVSLLVTAGGLLYNMTLSVTMGYALSRKNYPGRKFFLYFVLVTMFFSGGTIPYYLTVRSLGLVDSILSMILPMGINTFNMILLKNYFGSISPGLEESARIDGANDIVILFRIILPVSAPIIATVALFYAVERWNEYYASILFIRSVEKRPLQAILRDMLVNMEINTPGMDVASKRPVYGDALRMATIMITSVPILAVYPFVQKYFTKGIMLGSVKG